MYVSYKIPNSRSKGIAIGASFPFPNPSFVCLRLDDLKVSYLYCILYPEQKHFINLENI